MRTTKQLSITLPTGMADALTERISSGEHASESEVIRDGLCDFFAREKAVETWLWTEVAASYDALRADPSRAISSAVIAFIVDEGEDGRLQRSSISVGP